MATRRTVTAAALAVALVATLTACGDDDAAAPDTTTTSTSTTTRTAPTSTTTTTTTIDPEAALHAEILDAYRAALAGYASAGDPPDPNHPVLEATMTGAMLQEFREHLTDHVARGSAVRLPADSRRRVELIEGTMLVEGDVAIFDACALDDSRSVIGPEVPSDGRIWTAKSQVTMEFIDGVWKLSGRVPDEIIEGVTGCAEGWE